MQVLADVLLDAIGSVRMTGQAAIDNLVLAEQNGTLVLDVLYVEPHWAYSGWNEGAWYGEFRDLANPPCWDGCNGITNFHRAGWCRTNPEHADFDCGCDGGHDYEEDYEVEIANEQEPLDEASWADLLDDESEPEEDPRIARAEFYREFGY
jgi:hypothetical protein